MSKITFEGYKSAVKAQYEVIKEEDVSGILLNPTPAQLRYLCLMIFDRSLSNADENIFKLFFNVAGETSLRKSIENCDIARFRPVISFLKGEKDSGNSARIELAAILVGFSPRPYNTYLHKASITKGGNSIVSLGVDQDESVGANSALGQWVEKGLERRNYGRTAKNKVVAFAVLLSLFFMGYTVKNVVFPKKECMVWSGNHYEAVDCINEKAGVENFTSRIVLNENLLSFKQIEVNANTIFFIKGKPVVWYGKSVNRNYQYFNQPGLHPETGKTLKPISEYIIKKYISK